ncbi:MAG: hypothetical protein ACKVWR_06360 [Acidimicrobiales bacterium]
MSDDAEAVLDAARTALCAAGGDSLVALYALGSAAQGCLAPAVSDMALLAVVDDAAAPDAAARLEQAVSALAAEGGLAARLRLLAATPAALSGPAAALSGPAAAPLGLRAHDRLDLLEHGRLLHGDDVRAAATRPTPAELVIDSARFALEELAEPLPSAGALVAGGVRVLTRRVLLPARLLFAAATGLAARNDDAAAWYAAEGRPSAELVAEAFFWRTEPPDLDLAEALVAAQLVSLYCELTLDLRRRLLELGEEALAEQVRIWSLRVEP